jgi:hypothetical protein
VYWCCFWSLYQQIANLVDAAVLLHHQPPQLSLYLRNRRSPTTAALGICSGSQSASRPRGGKFPRSRWSSDSSLRPLHGGVDRHTARTKSIPTESMPWTGSQVSGRLLDLGLAVSCGGREWSKDLRGMVAREAWIQGRGRRARVGRRKRKVRGHGFLFLPDALYPATMHQAGPRRQRW